MGAEAKARATAKWRRDGERAQEEVRVDVNLKLSFGEGEADSGERLVRADVHVQVTDRRPQALPARAAAVMASCPRKDMKTA
eukprot:6203627-Pleurochrysis_carterae.AAC.1